MLKSMRKFLKDESGATAIEYALIAALIGIVIISGAKEVGTAINAKFTKISTALNTETAPNG